MGAILIFPSMLVGSFLIPVITIFVMIVVKVWEHVREGEDDTLFKNEHARQVRYRALVLGIISFLLAAYVSYIIGMESFLSRFYLMAAGLYFVILVITAVFHYRLSLHTASLGLAIYFIHAFFGGMQLWVVLITYLCLLLFIGWSRIVMGKHTFTQITVTAIITILFLWANSLVI